MSQTKLQFGLRYKLEAQGTDVSSRCSVPSFLVGAEDCVMHSAQCGIVLFVLEQADTASPLKNPAGKPDVQLLSVSVTAQIKCTAGEDQFDRLWS